MLLLDMIKSSGTCPKTFYPSAVKGFRDGIVTLLGFQVMLTLEFLVAIAREQSDERGLSL